MAKHALGYSYDVMTNYHSKCVQILFVCVCVGGGGFGNDDVNYFYWARQRMKFVKTLLRLFSLQNEIVEVI